MEQTYSVSIYDPFKKAYRDAELTKEDIQLLIKSVDKLKDLIKEV